jgi:hypothetical protein
LWGNATQILPFHFSHLWRYVTLPLSRKRSVVYPCACYRPLRIVVVVFLPQYHLEECPV